MKTLKTSIKSTLMIDDKEINNTDLINIFLENGLYLKIVSDKEDYIEGVKDNKYNCIMINSDLPNDNTTKIINQIKGFYPWIIVIIILNEPVLESVIKYVRIGVDDFIQKPFVWTELEALLKYYYY